MAFTDALHDMRGEVHDLVDITHVDAARQAFVGLWATFTVVPLLFGIDKFAGYISSDWDGFLANWVNRLIPGTHDVAVLGVVEILLAVTVALAPRAGGDLVAIYLVLTAISLFAIGGGTMVILGISALAAAIAAVAMARLSTTYHKR